MRFDPDRENAYVAVTASAATNGAIYRVPLGSDPPQGDPELFHTFETGEAPDQLAFDSRGNLYVSLLFANQISVLGPDGRELTRFQSAGGDRIPLDDPAGLAFDSRTKSLL